MRLVSVVTTRAYRPRHRAHFAQQIIDLGFDGRINAFWIDQTGWAHHLFDEHAASALHLPRARRRRDEHGLRAHGVPFFKLQRPVVHADGSLKPNSASVDLRAKSPLIHAADLRHGDVAFVDDQHRVFRQVLEQCRRRFARISACQIARNSSRCRRNGRWFPASRYRTWCAASRRCASSNLFRRAIGSSRSSAPL